MPNLSSVSIDGLLKLRDEVEKALSRRAKELQDQLSRLGRAPALRGEARLRVGKYQLNIVIDQGTHGQEEEHNPFGSERG
jgi:hypothetical protein